MGKLDDPSRPAAQTKTILIVDDDESILNLLEILVQRDGFKVLTAESVKSAVYKLQRLPDLIILDLIMPGSSSGLEVLDHTGKDGLPPPKVVVITAANESHDAAKAARADARVSHFLQKPIRQEQLLEILHRLLGTRLPKHGKQTDS